MMHRRRLVASLATLGGLAALPVPALARLATPFDLKGLVAKEQVPALGVIVVTSTEIKHLEVQGHRRLGGVAPVTVKDSWAFGDHTMGLTSAIFARLVEGGRLGWNARLESLSPTLPGISSGA